VKVSTCSREPTRSRRRRSSSRLVTGWRQNSEASMIGSATKPTTGMLRAAKPSISASCTAGRARKCSSAVETEP
jgi:hypothetical protein